MTVTAATKWASNADMMLDVVELGYIRPTDRVIDLTFGRGKWWSKYQHPGQFTANLDPSDDDALEHLIDHRDRGWIELGWISQPFDDTGLAADFFDVVVFDPPYVSAGGRSTTTIPDFHDRYGMTNAATTPELLQQDNNRGLAEAYRICRPGGLVLAKCAPYISSGVRKEGDWWTRDAALELGFTVEDMLIHLGDVRAQPKVSTCRKCGGKVNCTYCDHAFPTPLAGGGALPLHSGLHDGAETVVVCAGTGTTPVPCDRCYGKPPTERKQKHARNNYSVCFVLRRGRPKRGRVST